MPAAAGTTPPVRAESGVARGRLLPGADDPSWDEVPLHLRQQLRMAAYQLVTPVQRPLQQPENRRLLSAVRAAGRMRITGTHWLLLLTAERAVFGSPRSQRASTFYEVLEQILAQHPPGAPAGLRKTPQSADRRDGRLLGLQGRPRPRRRWPIGSPPPCRGRRRCSRGVPVSAGAALRP
ncbi:hypothetical protein, partial [Streptomyces sp. NRRL S-118]|uniref:hypothetical protein n=1 Tax=Streptomyces sp. NRRL S-118 TaxID=1463881 RepID=UPI001F29FEA0